MVFISLIPIFTKNQLTFNIMKKLLLTGFALVSMVSQAQTWVDQATQFPLNFGVDEMVIVDANTFGFLPTMVQEGELTQKLFLKP